MNFGKLAARGIIGGLFMGHGLQKLKGWFGGPGLEGTEQMMQSLEMEPARRNAVVAGAVETAGGAMVAAGILTPLASAGLIGTMITAIRKVHLPNGPWVTQGGYEYNLVLIAALLALADEGPGTPSVDAALDEEHTGPAWSLAALALGAATSAAVVELGRRTAQQQAGSQESPASGDS